MGGAAEAGIDPMALQEFFASLPGFVHFKAWMCRTGRMGCSDQFKKHPTMPRSAHTTTPSSQANPRMGGGFAKYESPFHAQQAAATAESQGVPAAIARIS